jgi:hypothetical protein
VTPGFDAQALPAVSHVAYDPAQNSALVTVATAGTPNQKLDLFYQDAASYDPAAKWKVWQLGVQPGPGTSFVFPLPIPQSAIPHPKFLLFQAADSLQDSSSDGLSDAYKTLVLGLDPAVFTPTPENALHLTRQVWWNLSGYTIPSLTTSPRYPWQPDVQQELSPLFDAPRDIGSTYGQRVFGRFFPPLTGYYRFQIASDDHGELWITLDGVRQKIAGVSGSTGWRQWTKYVSQTSAPIYLHAGTAYPLEALMKEQGGGDHLSVGIEFPDGRLRRPVETLWFLPPLQGQNDADADGMADAWETTHGLNPADPADAAASAAHDGVTNLEKYLLGLDPHSFLSRPENAPALTRQLWTGLSGNLITGLTTHPAFPHQPNSQTVLEGVHDLFEAPSHVADNYGQRMFGRFHAPLSGEYTFWIASDDAAELRLRLPGEAPRLLAYNTGATVKREWSRNASQRSVSLHLAAGQSYPLDALMKENSGGDHLAVGVQFPDKRYERPLRARRFLTPPETASFFADSDADGLSDYEEWVAGTDPANPDTSGDGISDFDAVALNRDPLAQHPAPLISAAWVLLHNIDPANAYVFEDFDNDGLANLEEFRGGSNPWLADSDNDGINDFTALRILRIDPAAPLITGQTVVDNAAPSSAAVLAGTWATAPDGSLVAQTRNGTLEYTLGVDQPGVYGLLVEIEQSNAYSNDHIFSLSLRVNGLSSGTQRVIAPHGSPASALFLSPALDAGVHAFVLRWDNTTANSFLRIRSVRLVQFQGPDADLNGIPDWLDQRNAAVLDADIPLASPVSPVCVEGESPHREALHLASSASEDPEERFPALPGLETNWYGNLPLDPAAPAHITITDSFSGVVQTNQVTWSVTELLPAPAEPLLLRVGDSLLLRALPEGENEGTVTLTIGTHSYTGSAADAIPHRFETPGNHSVTATWTHNGVTQQSQTSVRAVATAFADNPLVLVNVTRTWNNPGLAPESVIEHDPFTTLSHAPLSPTGRKLTLRVGDTRPRTILARLGEGGPVLDHAQLAILAPERPDRFQQIAILPDGSLLIEAELALGFVPPTLRLVMGIVTGGTLFENGMTSITFTADDFDANGVLRYRLIAVPGSDGKTCHRVTYYQD